MEDVNEKIEEIRNRIRGPDYFAMSRVPKQTRDWFVEFAKEEFCDDRGLAFKFLVDVYTGIISSGVEHLEVAVEDLNKRLTALEQRNIDKEAEVSKSEKIIKMLDGRTRGGKENE